MPSLSKLYQSAKKSFSNKKKNKERKASNDSSTTSTSSGKSVRFSTHSESIYYTHSSLEYDRSSMTPHDELFAHEGDSLKSNNSVIKGAEEEEDFDEEVKRNTKVNKKQGHYSIAALVTYRANI